jgi:hypothetical protein
LYQGFNYCDSRTTGNNLYRKNHSLSARPKHSNNYDKNLSNLPTQTPDDPICTHILYGGTEELFKNAKGQRIQVHGYTEETWNKEISRNQEHFKNLIKQS